MRIRTKRLDSQAAQFIDFDHPAMVILREIDGTHIVSGAYVKFAPTVRASERAAIDAKAIRERLLAAGAVAVVVAPVIVPDSIKGRQQPDKPAVLDSEMYLREWFALVRGLPQDVVELAMPEALASVREAGL
jgi:hypothetical protein